MPLIEIRSQGMTVDLVCHRHYGRTRGTTERVLNENPGLAALGPFIPLGTHIWLPEITSTPTKTTRSLWD
ncbi:tail protein X [Kaistia sp. MMO-174]|uniref:tail protein X n=1 Tax=Kaistia sp. MMO-174 TaxID=3081256 RepID=UPI003FA5963D